MRRVLERHAVPLLGRAQLALRLVSLVLARLVGDGHRVHRLAELAQTRQAAGELRPRAQVAGGEPVGDDLQHSDGTQDERFPSQQADRHRRHRHEAKQGELAAQQLVGSREGGRPLDAHADIEVGRRAGLDGDGHVQPSHAVGAGRVDERLAVAQGDRRRPPDEARTVRIPRQNRAVAIDEGDRRVLRQLDRRDHSAQELERDTGAQHPLHRARRADHRVGDDDVGAAGRAADLVVADHGRARLHRALKPGPIEHRHLLAGSAGTLDHASRIHDEQVRVTRVVARHVAQHRAARRHIAAERRKLRQRLQQMLRALDNRGGLARGEPRQPDVCLERALPRLAALGRLCVEDLADRRQDADERQDQKARTQARAEERRHGSSGA